MALTMMSCGNGYVKNALNCVWPLNGVTIRQIFWPLIVVAVNGVGVDSSPAPPAARLPGRLVATAPGESTLKQASFTLRPSVDAAADLHAAGEPRVDRRR